jgi:hypothetical protein
MAAWSGGVRQRGRNYVLTGTPHRLATANCAVIVEASAASASRQKAHPDGRERRQSARRELKRRALSAVDFGYFGMVR